MIRHEIHDEIVKECVEVVFDLSKKTKVAAEKWEWGRDYMCLCLCEFILEFRQNNNKWLESFPARTAQVDMQSTKSESGDNACVICRYWSKELEVFLGAGDFKENEATGACIVSSKPLKEMMLENL